MGPLPLQIDELLLDLDNPRISGAKSQRDALQKLVADQDNKLLVLAKSIIEDEGMNPLDRFLVVKHPKDAGAYIVVEGNRRLAALRILVTPGNLDDLVIRPALKRGFESLARRFDRTTVEPLSCFEVADSASATKWILLRHTGENEGKGVVAWSGLASSRFRGRDPALQALEFVKEHGNLPDDQRELLDSDFPITTLDRLLSSREVRQRLGFDVKNGKLVSGLGADELIKPLRQIVLDLADGRKTVSELKNKHQQIDYVESDFPKASKPDLTRTGPSRAVDKISAADFSSRPSRAHSSRRKKKPDPSERKTLIPKTLSLSISDNRVAAISGELDRLKLDHTPNAIAVLFRVFLELSIDHFMTANVMKLKDRDPKSGREFDKSLKVKLAEVVAHLVSKGDDRKDYQSVTRALSDTNSPLHPELLNAYVHNRFATPRSRDLKAAWDDAQPLFKRLWA